MRIHDHPILHTHVHPVSCTHVHMVLHTHLHPVLRTLSSPCIAHPYLVRFPHPCSRGCANPCSPRFTHPCSPRFAHPCSRQSRWGIFRLHARYVDKCFLQPDFFQFLDVFNIFYHLWKFFNLATFLIFFTFLTSIVTIPKDTLLDEIPSRYIYLVQGMTNNWIKWKKIRWKLPSKSTFNTTPHTWQFFKINR